MIAFFESEADLIAGRVMICANGQPAIFDGMWADGGLKLNDGHYVGQGAGRKNLKTDATVRSDWEDMQVSGQAVRTQSTEAGHREKFVYLWLYW